MKEIIKYSVLLIIISLISWGCRDLPEYSNIPSIEYNQVFFKKGELTDSLFVSIEFRDGDGDLGLHPDFDNGEPYHAIYHWRKDDGELLTYSDRNTPPYDTFPYDTILLPYEFPYYCTTYSIEESDTFWIQQNPDHFNIFVDFYVKKNGTFTLYDWITANPPQCGETYNGRFPILNTSGQDRPLEGTLKYAITGAGFEVIFKRDTLKLEIRIQDRALNKSNIVQTQEFVLKDITIN